MSGVTLNISLSQAPKPCPFCGKAASIVGWPDEQDRRRTYYRVTCDCDVMMRCEESCGQGWNKPDEAVEAWNDRPTEGEQ